MKLRLPSLRTRSAAAFTMVEIAIALGVIGFALVAIIGILPAGLEVQRDNRSETIINQDGTFWMEAIRNGARGLDELTNYVDHISIVVTNPVNGAIVQSNYYSLVTNPGFTTGAEVIGLLTTQAGVTSDEVRTNMDVHAVVAAFSGSAAEKEPDPANRELSFKYILRVQIEPAAEWAPSFAESTLLIPPRSEPLWSLYNLRVMFAYPFVREDRTPTRRQAYRALVSRGLTNEPPASPYFFFTQ